MTRRNPVVINPFRTVSLEAIRIENIVIPGMVRFMSMLRQCRT